MRWSEAITLEFVKMYLKHECLWNPEHPGYKVKRDRDNAYRQIYTDFKECTSKDLSLAEIRVKIKNLRTTYQQQVNKIILKSSPDNIYEPSLIWFHEMDQCLKHIPINRHANYNVQQTPEVHSSSQIWEQSGEQDVDHDETNLDPLTPQNDQSCESSHDDSNIKIETSPTSYKSVKKKKYRYHNPVYHVQDSFSDTSLRDDEFDIYGKYIASQLRLMDLKKALKLQLQIQSLVSKARISDS